MTWIVMCRVTGGVTGTRMAPLKKDGGAVKYFETETEARAEAALLMASKDSDRFRTASFCYWAEEVQS